jgi:hypothetical protein
MANIYTKAEFKSLKTPNKTIVATLKYPQQTMC